MGMMRNDFPAKINVARGDVNKSLADLITTDEVSEKLDCIPRPNEMNGAG
jgi:hypothetical protein